MPISTFAAGLVKEIIAEGFWNSIVKGGLKESAGEGRKVLLRSVTNQIESQTDIEEGRAHLLNLLLKMRDGEDPEDTSLYWNHMHELKRVLKIGVRQEDRFTTHFVLVYRSAAARAKEILAPRAKTRKEIKDGKEIQVLDFENFEIVECAELEGLRRQMRSLPQVAGTLPAAEELALHQEMLIQRPMTAFAGVVADAARAVHGATLGHPSFMSANEEREWRNLNERLKRRGKPQRTLEEFRRNPNVS